MNTGAIEIWRDMRFNHKDFGGKTGFDWIPFLIVALTFLILNISSLISTVGIKTTTELGALQEMMLVMCLATRHTKMLFNAHVPLFYHELAGSLKNSDGGRKTRKESMYAIL